MSFEKLNSFLDKSQISTDPKNLEFYGKDWIHLFKADPSLIVFPKTADQVVQLVLWARKYKQSLIPSGGRTGLSGGATASNKEVIVSFERMNQLIEFNEFEGSITLEPGVITKEVQKQASDRGFLMPISFAAEGSSQIGGNVATNAGGIHVIRYGSTRAWVKGLQVVTGEGHLLNLGKNLIKNATGYSLMDLFIGSEGTLGFITQVTLCLDKKPEALNTILLGISDLESLIEVYGQFKKSLSLYAFEMFTDKALEFVEASGSHTFPLSKRFPYYVIIEIEERQKEQALAVFENLLSNNKIEDGVISESSEQAKNLWALRENISESLSPYKPYKNDISVRISKLTQFLSEMQALLEKEYPQYEVVWFGHIGDGNLHINILQKDKQASKDIFIKDCERVNDLLFTKVKEYEGSISAEHGVGLLKKKHLHYTRSKEEVEYMRGIKKVFDPDNIINPGKIFDIK